MNFFVKGGITFHLFPHPGNNKELYDKWIATTRLENIKTTEQNRENYYLCEGRSFITIHWIRSLD